MTDTTLAFSLDLPGKRLDQALAQTMPDWSRVQWQRYIKEGFVTVNGAPAKPSMRLEGGEQIVAALPPVADTELVAEAIPLDIRYEDDDMLVVNKSADMVVHPAAGHDSGTLVNAVLHHCPDLPGIGGERRPGIVHRLDKDTSGLIVIAKNDNALRYLQNQFKERTVEKEYLALVDGLIHPSQALIDAPIGRDPRQRKKMTVIPPGSSASSRPAQTSYVAETFFEDHTLVRCDLHTGRTHQIRVHLAYIGFPIVGDTVYGRRKPSLQLRRQFLHAAVLTIRRPSDDQPLRLEAELPADLQAIIDQLTAS
ncbi:MAG: RluA family pseudouridine synthase [Anaerolineae bacterium]|nr:RluA family pseudouridine synthase [Anaerolineae bacterium]MCO5196642.1 RluA family pseudouridine synthase [Anaerolineae bacterium]